ncbi:MAG TPA: hypothetical protein VLQ29_01300 [Candidatus Dormibacteraeota bacterium]|nr:hypothetical protein [Candidatus Dormibacteraeota bacterium]
MAARVKGENDLAEYDPCCCRSDITTTIITNAHEISLERRRLRVVLATIVINILAVSLLTFAPWSDWRAGAALNIVDNCLLVGFALVRQDALLGRFLLFGLLVGFTELSADAWLVGYTRTLDYSIGGGPMIWRSPLWMPLAWEVVAVQFGYIGLQLWERFGKVGLLMIALLGAINIPFYEEMARRIHWWQYKGCRMISFTPWYIILAEFGIAPAFALLARTLRRGSWRQAVLAGIAGGFSIFVCYWRFGLRIDWSGKTICNFSQQARG